MRTTFELQVKNTIDNPIGDYRYPNSKPPYDVWITKYSNRVHENYHQALGMLEEAHGLLPKDWIKNSDCVRIRPSPLPLCVICGWHTDNKGPSGDPICDDC